MGDRIVTSGLGGTFPPGLTIGRVSHIVLEDRGLFKRASITPIVDLNRLEEVFIIAGDTQRSPDRNWRDQPLSNSDRQ
jgi:rod shape-determining protein MreC